MGSSTGDYLDSRIRLAEGRFLNPIDHLP